MLKQGIGLIVLFSCFSRFWALQCFLSCGEFDSCASSKCPSSQCGPSNQFAAIAFTMEECPTEEDRCIYREFILTDKENSQGSPESVHIPGGCLLTYQRSTQSFEKYLFGEGVKLYACNESFCNPPILETCDQDEAVARRQGESNDDECALKNGENLDQLLFGSTQLKGGTAADRRDFCLNAVDFTEFKEDASCFGTVGPVGTEVLSSCSSLADLEEVSVTTCEECEANPDCDVNAVTPTPVIQETLSPTRSPTVVIVPETNNPTTNPSASPTQTPTKTSLTSSPTTAVPTETPTSSPTISPSLSPTGDPTRNPTTLTPTESPEKQTSTPTISPVTLTPTSSPIQFPVGSASPTTNPTDSQVPEVDGSESLFEQDLIVYALVGGVIALCICAITVIVLFMCLRSDEKKKKDLEQNDYIVPAHDVTIFNNNSPGVYMATSVPLTAALDAVLVQQEPKSEEEDDDNRSSLDVAQFLQENEL